MASGGKKNQARFWMLVYMEIKQAMKLKDICSFRRKVVTNLESILKSRDITLPTKSVWSRLWFFQWSCMDVRVGLR